MVPDRLAPVHLALALALAALAVVLAGLWWRAARRRRLARRRGARAVAGERAAERLLVAAGYRVIERQAGLAWPIVVDGERVVIALRADYLVRDGARRLVAEVKTGEAAPLIGHPATRRQLLEYLVAYRADGVLLIDADAGDIAEVEFFVPAAAAARPG